MSAAGPGELAAYLSRIGLAGEMRPDLATLTAVHRAHVEAIAWECIDCFVGRPTTRDRRAAFDKIVRQGRGGWCYEMNGLLGWMLEAIGFSLTRVAAGVMRDTLGDDMVGNHLMLIVHLDRDYIADVGLGSGLIEPVPLAEGRYRQRHAEFRLERLDARWWRFHNQPGVMPPSFDFAPDMTDEALLEDRCRWLQADPASPFRQNIVVQRYGPLGLDTLVGRNAMRFAGGEPDVRPIADSAAYAGLLRDSFGIDPGDAAAIWARIGELEARVA